MLAVSIWMQMLVGAVLGVLLAVLFAFLKVKYGRNGRGIRLLNEGKYGDAERCFTELIDKGKTRSLAYRTALINRAVARIDGSKPEAALEDLQAAQALMSTKARTMRAAWLFNRTYCKIVLNELKDVPGQIAELEKLDVRPRTLPTRLRIMLAARAGRFDEAAAVADREAKDGPEERGTRARRLAHTLHAFVLSHAATADERRTDIDVLIAKAKAIDAPPPTGMGAQWPAWAAFLSENELG